MDVTETEAKVYRLKRFTSSGDKDFAKALKIYLENTDHNIITDTNEISYAIDFYNDKFPDADFTAVGLYFNKVLIGYCQFVYFKEERIVFIDYLVIEKRYRKNNSFFQFINEITEYFESKNYFPFFLLAEVSLQGAKNENEYSNKTRTLIRLLKMSNFGIINSSYFQPMLGLSNYETNLQALLMLYPADEHRDIKKDTFITILQTVYFKHYERWYTMFLKEKELREYSLHVHELYSKLTEKLKNITSIQLDSYSDLVYDKTTATPERVPKKVLYFLVGFILLIAILGCIAFSLKAMFSMEYKDQVYFLGFASFLYLVILSIFSDKASGILNKAIEKFIDKIT